ncbi:MAG: sel1 repeat family protein [Sulfuricella sp.]|nr:sel1 repeat family protein [Sulfuricella sp.]
MNVVVKKTRVWRDTRRLSLVALLGALLAGWGCATVNLPPPPDNTATGVYLPAAKKGNPQAQFQLATAYRNGVAGMEKNAAEALKWYGESARQGYAEACIAMGDIHLRGELGQTRNPEAGLEWLTRAARGGNLHAILRIAETYREGKWLPQDWIAARGWYEEAARRGNRYAANRLGTIYEKGLGVSSDAEAAYRWYLLADDELNARRMGRMLGTIQAGRAEADAAAQRQAIKMGVKP